MNNNKAKRHQSWRIGVWMGLALLSVSAVDAETGLVLTTNPTPILLSQANQPVHALLTLQNPTANPYSHVCIRTLTNGPIQTAITGLSSTVAKHQNCPDGIYLPELKANTSTARPMTTTLTQVPFTTPQVVLWADYESQVADKVIYASSALSLNLSVCTIPTLDNIKLTTATSFTSLQENATGKVVLTIDNKTSEQLDFTVSKPLRPENARIEPENDFTLTVPPQSTAMHTFSISVLDKVTPGKYLGVLEVSAQNSCGIPIRRSISYEVTLGVFGQSELLTMLNIPSILFLPGYLMLALWLLLWHFKSLRITWLAKAGSEEFFVGLRDAEFWLLGITISLLLYFSGTPWLSISNVQAYSLRDIAKLWTSSLFISLAVYLVLLYGNRKYLHKLEETRAATTLTRSDDVMTALKKITTRKYDLQQLRAVKSKNGVTPEIEGFLLWPAEEADSTWVIPQITVTGNRAGIGNVDPAEQGINGVTLLNRLEQILKVQGVQVKWAEMTGLNGPIVMKNTDLDDGAKFDLVVVNTA